MNAVLNVLSVLLGAIALAGLIRSHVRRVVRRAREPELWDGEADRLAHQYDIALPQAVAGQVATRIRREYVLHAGLLAPLLIVYGSTAVEIFASGSPHRRAVAYSVTVMSLPFAAMLFGVAAALPAWGAAREHRVAHLVRPGVRRAFTGRESAALGVGLAVTVAAGFWGFWRVNAGPWWLAWPLALALSGVVWWYAVKAILQRPARASDTVELGWDDVLRYRAARELTMCVAWLPALAIFLIDFGLWVREAPNLNLIPIYGVVLVLGAVGATLSRVFKQGRAQWRESWSGTGAN